MNCFTVSYPLSVPGKGKVGIIPGISLDFDQRVGPAVVVGDYNSPGQYGAVGICKHIPVDRQDDTVLAAHPFTVRPKDGQRSFWVLRKPMPTADNRALVLIDCSGSDRFEGRGHGFCAHLGGRVEIIAWGTSSCDYGNWCEALVVMRLGSLILVRFQGDATEHLLSYDDEARGPQLQIITKLLGR